MSRLDEIRERAEKATEGPWEWWQPRDDDLGSTQGDRIISPHGLVLEPHDSEGYYAWIATEDVNRDFIVCAREDIPHLLSLLAECGDALEEARHRIRVLLDLSKRTLPHDLVELSVIDALLKRLGREP